MQDDENNTVSDRNMKLFRLIKRTNFNNLVNNLVNFNNLIFYIFEMHAFFIRFFSFQQRI